MLHKETPLMNRGELSRPDPRRGLPSIAERQKTNVPLENEKLIKLRDDTHRPNDEAASR